MKLKAAEGKLGLGERGSRISLLSAPGLDEWDRRISKINFPGYRLIGKIGAGGMGRVYKATQSSLDRPVAIKVLDAAHLNSDHFRSHFLKEVEVLSKLRHPGIVSIIDAGEADNVPFLVMEYVEGITLRRLIAAQDLTPDQVVVICSRICDALDAAHRMGIAHFDLKPENVIVSRQGVVKVMDFGIAVMRDAGGGANGAAPQKGFAGTKIYMAPEQMDVRTFDARADVYSLGVMTYEMLTLSLPTTPVQPPSQVNPICPRWLDKVVAKALAVDPTRRFVTAGDVAAALEKYSAEAKRLVIEAEFAQKAALQINSQTNKAKIRPVHNFRRSISRTLGGAAFISIACSMFVPYMANSADNTSWYTYQLLDNPIHLPFVMITTAVACLSLTSACLRWDIARCVLQLFLGATSVAAMCFVLKSDPSIANGHWFSMVKYIGPGSFCYWGGSIALLVGSLLST